MKTRHETLQVSQGETVTALHYEADLGSSAPTLVLAHGAGADQRHPFMVTLASGLARRGIQVTTFNFLYTEKKKRAPDRNDALESCYRAVLSAMPRDRLFIGGKSMGGRIASQVVAGGERVSGLVFLGYPLHPPGDKDKLRTAHWPKVSCPSLFVQGTRDPFGGPAELEPHLKRLGAMARILSIEGGDHSFKVPKKSGLSVEDIFASIEEAVVEFIGEHQN